MDLEPIENCPFIALERCTIGLISNAILAAGLIMITGCAHPGLNSARENFYLGRFEAAATNLNNVPEDKHNRILLLMERGSIMQSMHKYEDSTKDWVTAWEFGRELDYYSLSEGTASFVINDRVKAFQGMPYERTLLHAFAAKSYFAMQMWDDAAVEARNIIKREGQLNGFPDDAYSHYIAGLSMEMIYNEDSASREYKLADKLLNNITITDNGQIIQGKNLNSGDSQQRGPINELLCFIMIGRAPTEYGSYHNNYRWGPDPYAEIYVNDQYLGRSYTFSNTQKLLAETQIRLAALRTMKDITRIAIKEAAAQTVSTKNEYLGEILRLVLFSFESTSERRWETLPLWLQIARVPCPADIKEYKVVFKGTNNKTIMEQIVSTPLTRRGNIAVSFCRDIKEIYSTTKPSEPAQQ